MAAASCGGRVLLVDDDPQVLRVHERALTRAGFVVVTASDGFEAVERMKGGDFDTILSDIAMPRMDGITLLRAVRETNLDLPIVLLTGEPRVETAIDAIQHGALRYLVKPVKP